MPAVPYAGWKPALPLPSLPGQSLRDCLYLTDLLFFFLHIPLE
jgi:hypothetical protein